MKYATLALCLTLTATPLFAQAGPWGREPGWGGESRWQRDRVVRGPERAEGKVEVATFVSDGADAAMLGKGGIVVIPAQAGPGSDDPRAVAVFESALLDQLASHGYDSTVGRHNAPQTAEIRLLRDVAVPQEEPHRPVSGEMSTTIGTRGSGFGLALNVDLSKPRAAMISTRLEARIRDAASGAVIWEGHAEMLSREGSERWTDQEIAAKLSAALLRDFPRAGTSPR
jgi:hypothetical protein